ncbi:MAG TPA: rod shape-determining protein MreC [Syntrophales bacterium]|nr:rod shape-determining protein MreC [Syntrophales bacterium]HPX12486.1 rod shape-determining protein MreC [Syntrophales bacterium]HQN77961.1 rod shape-determining protein MreC [Syntrophales bacterium]HQQ26867.1 rod shape-determining protein MreC [Syntrophales bacterium]
MANRKYKVALLAAFMAVLFLIPLAFLVKPSGTTGYFRKMVLEVVLPLEGVFQESIRKVGESWKRYLLLVHAEKENQELRSEVNRLKNRINELREADLESRRLRRLMGLSEAVSLPMTAARVTGAERTSVFHVLYISKGTAHGIRPGMPVLTDIGVGGRIIEASWHASKVLLITDFNSNVDALVQRSRVQGILQGAGPEGCVLKYVPSSGDVQAGDEVITSGLVGIFPKGFLLGTVSRVEKEKTGLFQKIVVKPAVDPALLEEVMVLLAQGKQEQ